MLRNMLRNNGLSILTYDFFIMIHDSELSFKVLGRFGNMLRTCCAHVAQCCAMLRNIAQHCATMVCPSLRCYHDTT
jgi:hypothetical protein